MALTARTRLRPSEVLTLIGGGGMGEVYPARNTRSDRTLAINFPPPDLSADADWRARFEREARTIAQFAHPHICTLHDVRVRWRQEPRVVRGRSGRSPRDRRRPRPREGS